MRRLFLLFLLFALIIVASVVLKSLIPQSKPVKEVSPQLTDEKPTIEVVAENLEIPWEMEFLPDGKIIFTERPGRVRILDTVTHEIDDVAHIGEGGLLGLALHPDFRQNNYIYLYYTYREGGAILNKVERFKLMNNTLQSNEVIIDRIPGAANHDGGRIKFGPDGKLYITTGDAANPQLSQDINSLAGKILRLNEDGSVSSDNPFGNPVWSYGHRNPQGFDWDSRGRLWTTEHGSSAFDEVNLIERGKNYGWPEVRGSESAEGLVVPVKHSGSTTWAPSGAVIHENSLFFAGLRGGAVYELDLNTRELKEHFKNQFGRIRSVTLGPDAFFYILTSNRDGRGRPISEDDRIIKIHPNLFLK